MLEKRLIYEMAELRGGKTRLKSLRSELAESYESLLAEAKEVGESLDLIDKLTAEAEQAPSDTVSEPVDSIGE